MLRISTVIREDKEYLDFLEALSNPVVDTDGRILPIAVNGLAGGAEDAFLTESVIDSLSLSERGTVLILADTQEHRDAICTLLSNAGIGALPYKPREFVFGNISASHDTDRERLSVLHSLLCGKVRVVVTTPEAAVGKTMPPDTLDSSAISVSLGDTIPPCELIDRLIALGFKRTEIVEGRGQLASRGGIVDFFADGEYPVRVEFFGDEIDRMVYFDPLTQRSISSVESVQILPACEVLVGARERESISEEIKKLLKNNSLTETVRESLMRELASVKSDQPLYCRDKYINLIYPEGATLFDYICAFERATVFLCGTSACKESVEKYSSALSDTATAMINQGALSRSLGSYTIDPLQYSDFLSKNLTVHLNPFAGGVGNTRLGGLFGFRSRRTVGYGNNVRMLFEDLHALQKGAYRSVLLSENTGGAQSLLNSLTDEGIGAIYIPDLSRVEISAIPSGCVVISIGSFCGFDLPGARVAVLSMSVDSGRAVMANRQRQKALKRMSSSAKQIMSYQDLTPGDYVVHANYGIGLFEGVEAVSALGVTKDYITIRYAGTDKLFVPCDRLEMIGKYIGQRDKNGTVKLSRMGGGDWTKTKSRAKAAATDIAKDLIALYAERQRRPGFAFSEDCDMELEFAGSFPFEQTDSQTVAIREIKADMMKSVPMNRLLCGDVGFGKTEVALRAAFKAVVCGKQVAFLVPTTILALQHYQTVLSRMRGYAINVEMISRLKKPKERERILERTRRGEVDILIGTHALLSKNVGFKDLGLLIIDEEQRFGVVQKEKLRDMARNVDTLMLSATPIPRTLNMAMSGINDISVLDEAPGERRPVQTYVLEHDEAMITEALEREIARGGQALYINNKIENLDIIATRLSEAIPSARVAYAHGRMEKDELEDIWHSLVRGDIDILVCTTIIETGVDLPGANTLVIENADNFGLSQLHQIRGRVGRSERQAYAYFTYRPGKALSEEAVKRLDALREFAEFGAGFKIAMRDLEIRGAGNLLGAEQHGYIESVGYDLYLKLLNEAVLKESGRAEEEKFESTVVINISANIPESYIASSSTRMEMYKRISAIETPSDALDVLDEFVDRFGDMPKATERLINVAVARSVASKAKISKIEAKESKLIFISEKPDIPLWAELFAKYPTLSFISPSSLNIAYRLKKGEDPTDAARKIMQDYFELMNDGKTDEPPKTVESK